MVRMKTASIRFEDIPLPPRYRVCQIMREWMDDGRLADGQPIPSERELCQRLGVGRSAVRSALAMLVRDGVIVEDSRDSRVRVVKLPQQDLLGKSQAVSQVLNSAVVVLTPHPEPSDRHSQPGWVEQIVQGAIRELRTRGYDVLAMHPDRLEDTGLSRLLAAPPLGVLLPEAIEVKTNLQPALQKLQAAGVPIVVYGGAPSLVGFDRVSSDHEAGAYKLTCWMINHGRPRVLMSWPSNASEHYWYPARRAGYERAMIEAGLVPAPTLIVPVVPQDITVTSESFEFESRRQVGFFMEVALPHVQFDALLCHTDGAVPYAAEALRMCGCEPGVDVLIAGYDNYALETEELQFTAHLPCITMDKLNWEMGQAMVELLMDRISGKLSVDPVSRIVTPRLVELAASKHEPG